MKIHFALNLEDKGTPDDVETIGLFDIKDKNGKDVTEEKILDLILVQNVFIEKAID